jgi:elongation factor P
VVRLKDKLLSVLKATISAQGRGRSNLIIEWRDIRSGSKITETIIPSTKMHKIFLSKVEFEYLYTEGEELQFMNQDSYEQVAVPAHLFDDALPFVRSGPLSLSNRKPLSLSNRKPLSLSNRKPLSLSNHKPLSLSNLKPLKKPTANCCRRW